MNNEILQDENGTGLLHKAVYYNHRDIADWLMDKYPESMSVRDNVSTSIVGLLDLQIIALESSMRYGQVSREHDGQG